MLINKVRLTQGGHPTKSLILAIIVALILSAPSVAVDKNWIHDEFFEVAQRIWKEEVDFHSKELLQSYGLSSKAQALTCTVDNPVQYIRFLDEQYGPGVQAKALLKPLKLFEFGVYHDGEMVNRILIREIEGEWKVAESELCYPHCFDAAGMLYERFPGEDVRVMKTDEITYLIFKGDEFEKLLELKNDHTGFIERDPAEWMAIQKKRLDGIRNDPRFREAYEKLEKEKDNTDSKHE